MPRARRAPEPPVYTFRVRILGGYFAPPECRSLWREIAVAANQTLGDLGHAIPLAFGFDDPHLWSFFLSGKAWDTSSEYAYYPDDDFFSGKRSHDAKRTYLRNVPFPGKTGKKEFLFLFDFGDEWHFGVKLLRESVTLEPGTRYPQVVASAGENPPQYPDIPEDEEELVVIEVSQSDLVMLGLGEFALDGDALKGDDSPRK
jgi:hypothetical protein